MAKQKRSDDWGFPRWRSYGDKSSGAAKLRLCDREGCNEVGDRPAPKAPNSKDRWYFCEAHAAEYNKNWNYFAGLSPEEAARRAAEEETGAKGFRQSSQWKWAGPGDGWRLDGLYGQYVYVDHARHAVVTITAHEETRDHRLVQIASTVLAS